MPGTIYIRHLPYAGIFVSVTKKLSILSGHTELRLYSIFEFLSSFAVLQYSLH